MQSIFRIKKVQLSRLQNVENGEITFVCGQQGKDNDIWQADILGIYGQNGSGKTTFINAINLLKLAIDGENMNDFAHYIMCGQNKSKLKFKFLMKPDSGVEYDIDYEFEIEKYSQGINNINELNEAEREQVRISYEKLSCSYKEAGRKKNIVLLECPGKKGTLFTLAKNLKSLRGELGEDLRVAKKLADKEGTSFIFSDEMLTLLSKAKSEPILINIIRDMKQYGRHNLYVISTRGWGPINLNIGLPFYFKLEQKEKLSMGSYYFNLDGPTTIQENVFTILDTAVNQINIVLCKIIPDLQLRLKSIGKALLPNGKKADTVELIAERGDTGIPLRFESEGIKKIVAILSMLIAAYNNRSMTLAIDELDAGIFEYLLGELLKIFKETGKGQLIFTSHNLRPLEILDKCSVAFTTVNSQNRYIRMKNVKSNNNLRDFYYRDILLGGQNETLYEETNNSEIAYAMRKLGDFDA